MFWSVAITAVAADDRDVVARRRDAVAKRARDEDLREEGEARGWSSAIPDRSLALRRRRGCKSSTFARATNSVAVPKEESCSRLPSSDVLHLEPQAEGMGGGSSIPPARAAAQASVRRPCLSYATFYGSCGALLRANVLGHPVYSKRSDTMEEPVQEVQLHLHV